MGRTHDIYMYAAGSLDELAEHYHFALRISTERRHREANRAIGATLHQPLMIPTRDGVIVVQHSQVTHEGDTCWIVSEFNCADDEALSAEASAVVDAYHVRVIHALDQAEAHLSELERIVGVRR